MPENLNELTTDELIKRKKELQNIFSTEKLKQETVKITLNSCYGSLGSEYGRYFDLRHAEGITHSGQMIIRYVANKINEFLNKEFGTKKDYIIGSDTDSVTVTLHQVVNGMSGSIDTFIDTIDKYCEKKLQPIINKAFFDIHTKLNTYESILGMKREVIAEHGVWTAKKHYLMWMHDNEGVRYNPPKLKIVGIEAVRSSTPKYARAVIKEALEHFVKSDSEKFYELIETAEANFGSKPFEDIASPRSVNGLDVYPLLPNGDFSLKTPIHVKGSLIYNKLLVDNNLINKYPTILAGQKIKFCYLKPQNPFNVNVIASPNKLPVELNIEPYLDRDEQFQRTLIAPLEKIVKFAGWTATRQNTLF